MVAYLSGLVLKILGWKPVGTFPDGKKYVVLVVPHTSMFDFILGRLYYNSINKSVKSMVKEKYFFFPLGFWLKSLGCIPVVMNRKTGFVDQMVNEFNERDSFLLTVTPEATRTKVNRWKKGFYYISKQANVPIILAYLDYEKKILGGTDVFYPTDDEKADFEYLRKYYTKVSPRHPEKYNYEKNI